MNYIRCLGNNLVHWRNLSKESKCLKMILARGVLYIKGQGKGIKVSLKESVEHLVLKRR